MTTDETVPSPLPAKRRRAKATLTATLVLSFGALIVAGMVLVQGISMWSAQKNTRALLSDNAQFAVFSLVRETRRRLAPVKQLNEYIQRLIDSGQIDINDQEQFGELLLTAVAGTEQVYGMAFVYPDGSVLRVRRGRGVLPTGFIQGDVDNKRALAVARQKYQTFWGKPVWLGIANSAIISAQTPIREGEAFKGILISAVTINALSRFIARSAALPLADNRFILYGRDHVLAHRSMEKGDYARQRDLPLPKLSQVKDRILANLWTANGRGDLLIDLTAPTKGHSFDLDGDLYVYLYRELEGFGDTPLIVGIYAGPEDGLGIEFRRLQWAGIAGVIVIFGCVLGALLIGRKISAPIRALAEGSGAVAELELDRVMRLEPSRVRELDDAADAFNRMTTGLRSFETYVPRQLVRRLIARDSPVESEQKEITVMFTDIVGFSTLSEHMPASETAAMLNEHFAILVDCIESEGGTVDKYIGDSVMAFWEPDETGANVDRALRAARLIRDRVSRDNEARRRDGRVAPKVRVGIHTGDAIVGNIGAPGRVNYTLVGDTVNIAARLEQLSKKIGPDTDTQVLVSGDTVALAGSTDGLRNQGRHGVRGRAGDIDVWSMD